MLQLLYGSLLIGGLFLAWFASWHHQKTKKLLANGIKTTAVVADLLTATNSDGDILYKPVFNFTDKSGQLVSFKSNVSSRPASYAIGEKVKIIYELKDNTNVKIVSYWGLYRWTIILLSIAAPLLIIGGGYFLYTKGF